MLLARAKTCTVLTQPLPLHSAGSFSSTTTYCCFSHLKTQQNFSELHFSFNRCSFPTPTPFFPKRSICTLFPIFLLPVFQEAFPPSTLFLALLLRGQLWPYLSHPWIIWPSNSIWHWWLLISCSWKHFVHLASRIAYKEIPHLSLLSQSPSRAQSLDLCFNYAHFLVDLIWPTGFETLFVLKFDGSPNFKSPAWAASLKCRLMFHLDV